MDELDRNPPEKIELPAELAQFIRRSSDLPMMTRYRWAGGHLPKIARWLLNNPEAARRFYEAAQQEHPKAA